jgi:hypothetical protein
MLILCGLRPVIQDPDGHLRVQLESTVRDIVKVGLPRFSWPRSSSRRRQCLVGGVGPLLLPDRASTSRLLGGALTATTVGITARVLQESAAQRRPKRISASDSWGGGDR